MTLPTAVATAPQGDAANGDLASNGDLDMMRYTKPGFITLWVIGFPGDDWLAHPVITLLLHSG